MNANQHPQAKAGAAVPKRVSFEPHRAGLPVEVDGGAEVPGTGAAARETYSGVLTGRRMEYGDPPWPWLEVVIDEGACSERRKLWCDESFVYPQTPTDK